MGITNLEKDYARATKRIAEIEADLEARDIINAAMVRDRDALKADNKRLRGEMQDAITELGGPKVWGQLNEGQMQCGCCQYAYVNLEDVIAALRDALEEVSDELV